MRYGLCMNMVAADDKCLGLDLIPSAVRLGFDYVELPLAQIMALSDREFTEEPLRALSESDIDCTCCNNFFPGSFRLTGPNADTHAALAYAESALDRAFRLGANRVVFGSSGARNIPDGFPIARGMDQLEDLLRGLAPIADARGIIIVIEPLNRIESNVINSLAEGLELARRVSHKAVASLVDFYHAGLSGNATSAINNAGGLLRHVHFARILGRSMPVSEDEDAYLPFIKEIKAIGYDETISLEANVPNDFMTRTACALNLLKRMWA